MTNTNAPGAIRRLHHATGRIPPKWRNALLGTAASLALLHAGACAYLFGRQRSLLYRPQPRQLPDAHDELRLNLNGNELQITYRAATQPPHSGMQGAPQSPALIYFGGNSEDVSVQLKRFARLWPHRSLYLVHYRGWGRSGGKPTEENLVLDALSVFDHVHASHDQVAVIGRSLGTGVAIQVASQRPVSALVLVTPYDSITQVARAQMPFWLPVKWLLRDRWESVKAAPKVTAPTTVIQAGQDALITAPRTQTLLDAFPEGVAKAHVLADADHHTVLFKPHYHQLLTQAID